MTALTIKPAVTFVAFRNALRLALQKNDNTFLNKLYSKDLSVEAVCENKVEVVNNLTGEKTTVLVAGKKVIVLKGQAAKNSVNIGLNRDVSLNSFLVNENGFSIDLEDHSIKAVTVSTGWVPADGVEAHLTVGAIMALSNITLASSKGSSGEVEHFVFAGKTGLAASGIVELRTALTELVEANGGFVVAEQAPKVRKQRTTSFNSMETSKGTSAEFLRVEGRFARETRNAEIEAEKDAKVAQQVLSRRNIEENKNSDTKPLVVSFASMEMSKGTSTEALRVEKRFTRETHNVEKEAMKDAKLAQKIRDRRNAEALKAA